MNPRPSERNPGSSTATSTNTTVGATGQPRASKTGASAAPSTTDLPAASTAPSTTAPADASQPGATDPPAASAFSASAAPSTTAPDSSSQPGAAISPGTSTRSASTADLPAASTAAGATASPTALASTVQSGAAIPPGTSSAARSPASPSPATAPRRPGLAAGLLAWFAERPPAAGSAVMATGIVSVGLRQVGAGVLSDVALALAGVLWLALAEDFGQRLVWQRRRWTSESHTPAALTAVAATTVLGVRVSLAGWQVVAVALLVVATLLWPLLLWAVLRHLKPHMPGAVFLICVATQGMATLSATLGAALPARWLCWPALVLFVVGLGLYLYALGHFDGAAVRDGAGDHWVAGGALAISALACAKLTEAKSWTGALHSTLRVTALVLIALAWLWYVVLAAAEIRWPRLHYDVRRWATIFPMGMTGAATTEVAKATGWSHLTGVGHTLVWIAAAAWLVVFIGLVRNVAGQVRPAGPTGSAGAGKSS